MRSDAPTPPTGEDLSAGFRCAARARSLVAEQVDLRNSGDTAGDRDRVVGYGAFAFHAGDAARA